MFVTQEQFEKLEVNPNVVKIENNGNSGLYYGYTWYTVYYADGTEQDIYYK